MDGINIVPLLYFLFEDVEQSFCSTMQKMHVTFLQNGLCSLDSKVDYSASKQTQIIDRIVQSQEVYTPPKSTMKTINLE